jgi:hypothetical protein
VEAALVVVAFVVAALLLGRAFRGEPVAPAPPAAPAAYGLPTPRVLSAAPALATVLPGPPQLRIFATRPSELARGLPPPGDDYTLTLARGSEGRWSSVLRAPPVVSEGGALTVTLVVPWHELAHRYSAVNLVGPAPTSAASTRRTGGSAAATTPT